MLAVRYRIRNREFLKRVFKKYPNYNDFKFFCPGESYVYYVLNNEINLLNISAFKEQYKNVKIIDPNEEI
jgi:hypothetical protein